jgi:glycoside/pentoside/hexuronide:cation symporter, GPH family
VQHNPGAPPQRAWQGGWRQGLSYGALGLPLAFVALPLYVVLPNHYASEFAVPLAVLGALLLGTRLLDALVDPLIGRWADRWLAQGRRRVLAVAWFAALLLALGFRGLFFPPAAVRADQAWLLPWCAALLALTYLSFSVLSVLHQAWGARLGGGAAQRARIVSWREGLALVGVLVASVLPSVLGLAVAGVVFTVALALALVALQWAPLPQAALTPGALAASVATPPPSAAAAPAAQLAQLGASPGSVAPSPLATPAFRRLLAVYLVNGVASAVPATLVLFFIRDRLNAAAWEPLFLASYFAAGALSMPLWLRAVARLGLARAWLLGMVLAVVTFGWAAALGAGDVLPFALVCVASGVALGADLTLPGALLAGVIQRAGHGQALEGAYFGWWNFATKLNGAVAAGLALPLLAQFGYSPGEKSATALHALTIAYCLLPCVLKLLALGLLWRLWLPLETDR